MSARLFIQKENINMLWDVISDEEVFRFLPRDSQTNIYQLFMNNLQGFYDSEKKKTNSIVDINKKYIMLILGYIKKNFPVLPSKITIHNEPPTKPLITFEEIQNERKSKFEEELSRKQEEFEDFMSVKVPPVPEFSDKDTDTPIKEMDKILKEMQMQRNYEIEQISRNHNNTSQSQIDNWLKPQDASLKPKDASLKPQDASLKPKQHDTQNNSRFKNVSFSNVEEVIDNENENDNYDDDDTIFSKLKKVKQSTSTSNDLKIQQLERNMQTLNEKMDMILQILNKSSTL